ncbi:MAG: thiamine diphosphokinase [Geminicoccaceae bacterium]
METAPADPNNPLFRAANPVLLIGGAPVDMDLLKRLAVDRALIAADSGADAAFAAGLVPDLVLGDLDSISDAEQARQRTRVIQIPDQNTTDLQKALAYIEAPMIVGLGFLGARFDHSLAAVHALSACTKPQEILLADTHDVVLRVRGDFAGNLAPGLRFSIWPLGIQTFRRSTGLRYPLDGLTLQSGKMVGTSNEVTAPEVFIEAGVGQGYLVITPIETIDALLASRLHQPRPGRSSPNSPVQPR